MEGKKCVSILSAHFSNFQDKKFKHLLKVRMSHQRWQTCSRRPPDESTIKGRRQSASEAAAANKGWSKLASAALAGLANCCHEGTKVI